MKALDRIPLASLISSIERWYHSRIVFTLSLVGVLYLSACVVLLDLKFLSAGIESFIFIASLLFVTMIARQLFRLKPLADAALPQRVRLLLCSQIPRVAILGIAVVHWEGASALIWLELAILFSLLFFVIYQPVFRSFKLVPKQSTLQRIGMIVAVLAIGSCLWCGALVLQALVAQLLGPGGGVIWFEQFFSSNYQSSLGMRVYVLCLVPMSVLGAVCFLMIDRQNGEMGFARVAR